jgi:hypothetical protein
LPAGVAGVHPTIRSIRLHQLQRIVSLGFENQMSSLCILEPDDEVGDIFVILPIVDVRG